MRPIKFRAWDKIEKRLYKVHRLDFANEMMWVSAEINGQLHAKNLPFEDSERMQFTGLLDKSGKEIYEGDIIKIVFGDWINEPDQTYLGSIEYVYVSFKVKIQKTWVRLIGSKTIEIIGNIYENPELLKVDKVVN